MNSTRRDLICTDTEIVRWNGASSTWDCIEVEIVARQTVNFNRVEGLTVFENIQQAEPEINGVIAQ